MNHDPISVAPALERYTQETLLGEVWKRSDLTTRDRSLVTLAALVARNQTIEMAGYVDRALDSDVKPAEISEPSRISHSMPAVPTPCQRPPS